MFDGENQDRIVGFMEANAIVAYPQSKLRGLKILKTFDIAFPGGKQTCQSVQDSKGRALVDGAGGRL